MCGAMTCVIDLCEDEQLPAAVQIVKKERAVVGQAPLFVKEDEHVFVKEEQVSVKDELITIEDEEHGKQLIEINVHPEEDVELATLRKLVSDAQRTVSECQIQLTHATTHLQDLSSRLAERQSHIQQLADNNFNWSASFPWTAKLAQQLTSTFKISTFRPLQHEALNATLLKRDVFAILPTGAGKSLIYQLAAVVEQGLTLVITPLISLSMDQRASLCRRNIRAESLDSTAPKKLVKKIYEKFLPPHGRVNNSRHPRKRKGGNWRPDDMNPSILFVTPEQVAKSKRLMSRLEGMHQMGHLTRICIDEAHCASSWGHDFRPEYRKLGLLRRQLPRAPILCLSATCAVETTEEVCKILEMKDCVVFRGAVDRPNLYYQVREKKADEEGLVSDLSDIINGEFGGCCGIVYVLSRKDAENYAGQLRVHGIKAAAYHGDLDRDVRKQVHEKWSDGRLLVVIATIAFGLGIDNPNVRFVIHATMATSLEAYYQESGRAGRDGKPATCIILHRAREFSRLSGFVVDKGGDRLEKMYAMYQYACSRGAQKLCRRSLITQAFGQTVLDERDRKTCCDLCRSRTGIGEKPVIMNVTHLAKSAAKWITAYLQAHQDEKVTLNALATAWANSGAKGKNMRMGEKMIDRGVDMDTRMEILVELVFHGVLVEYHRHSSYAVNAYVKRGRGKIAGDVMVVVRREAIVALERCGCVADTVGKVEVKMDVGELDQDVKDDGGDGEDSGSDGDVVRRKRQRIR